MSVRSIQRSKARAEAAERRREARRIRRAGLAAGAAIGATVVFAPTAMGATFQVDTLADPGNGDGCATTDCSLREAINDANANGVADTITFANGLTGEITLTAGALEVSSSDGLTITGPGQDVISISGDANTDNNRNSGDSQVLYVDPYAQVAISGLTLTEGYTSNGPYGLGSGGAIEMNPYSDVSLTDSTVSDSYADLGGGIANGGGTLTVTRSDITGNDGAIGGGIFSTGVKYNASLDNQSSRPADQGIGDPATSTIVNSTVEGNGAELGGGIFSSGAKYFDNTTAPDPSSSLLTITGTTITGNDAGAGGGTFSKYSDTSISDSHVDGNTANGSAGVGSYGSAATMDIDGTTISGNTATSGGGGAISSGKYAQLNVTGSTLTDNYADYAGAIEFSGDFNNGPSRKYDTPPVYGPSKISGTTIAGNQALYDGGGIEVLDVPEASSFKVVDSTISGNSADLPANDGSRAYGGGGIAFYGYIDGDVAVSNSTISGNSAGIGGGISFDDSYQPAPPPAAGSPRDQAAQGDSIAAGSVLIGNSTIASNTATDAGGGIYLGGYSETNDGNPPYASGTIPLSSTIVGDNTAGAAANDLAMAPVADPGGFTLTNSLVETPGSAPVTQNPAGSSIVGTDPALGALADNGGPTRTQLPAATSPVVDAGLANGLTTDQRGLQRTVDYPDVPATHGSDGTDIGSVELQNQSHTRALQRSEVPRKCEGDFETATLALAGDDTSQTLTGTDGPDILRGFGGDDTVLGLPGDDCLTGDDGNDLLKGAEGADYGDGGSGEDVLNGAGGSDELRGADDNDKIKLAAGDDKGVGGGGEDRVMGGTGDDAVRGRFGPDKVYGDDGNDAARGGGGDDRVDGGKGNDTLRGGGGDDVLVLGGGSDAVNCGKGEDKVIGAGPNDDIAGNCEDVS